MRRLIIIRKDLHLSPGKLMAMSMHLAEAFWTNFLKNGKIQDMEYIMLPAEEAYYKYRHPAVAQACKEAWERGDKFFKFQEENPEKKYMLSQKIDKDIWDEYVNGIFTKTICEAKNLNQLRKVDQYIETVNAELPEEKKLVQKVDYGWINDKCLTELTPENDDGTTTIGIWFRPLPDDIAAKISMKYKLYGAFDKKKNCESFNSLQEAKEAYNKNHSATDTSEQFMEWLFQKKD